jgi:hypothetical protein
VEKYHAAGIIVQKIALYKLKRQYGQHQNVVQEAVMVSNYYQTSCG